jgi:serine/threonine protein kinase
MAERRVIADYEIGETLGSGLQGKVKLGRHLRTGEVVALKIIDREAIKPRELHNLKREIRAMELINPPHPNTVGLRAVFDNAAYPRKRGKGTKEVILLVIELATGGELFDYMMYTGQFPEPIALAYFRQLLSALSTCHRAGVYHRDIKPENLLLDSNFNLKVADFGLSALDAESSLEPGDRMWLRTECGTRGYMAPEILAHQSYQGDKADVWSAGVVLFIMLGGFPPFQQATLADWWFKAVTLKNYGAFWDAHSRSATFSEGAKALLNTIFVADPAERATVEQVLAHPTLNRAGDAMAPDVMKADLLRRKAAVDREKHAAREAERAKKEEARQREEGKAEYDPFAQDVFRTAAASEPAPVLPPMAGQPEDGGGGGGGGGGAAVAVTSLSAAQRPCYTVMHSYAGAADLHSRIGAALASMPPAQKAGKAAAAAAEEEAAAPTPEAVAAAPLYRTKACAATPSGAVNFSAEVFRMSAAEGSAHVVQVRRRNGDALEFQKLFAALQEKLADVLCGDPALSATAAAAKEAGAAEGAAGGEEEEDIADEVVDPFGA